MLNFNNSPPLSLIASLFLFFYKSLSLFSSCNHRSLIHTSLITLDTY